jgi:hypothetical protein
MYKIKENNEKFDSIDEFIDNLNRGVKLSLFIIKNIQ